MFSSDVGTGEKEDNSSFRRLEGKRGQRVRLTKRVKIAIIIITCVLGFYFGLDIWMKLINKLFGINKVSHASTFDLSDVELDKYDFIWSFIKKKVIGFIGHFKSKKAFLSWLISIPIWVFDFIYNSHISLYID